MKNENKKYIGITTKSNKNSNVTFSGQAKQALISLK